MNVGVLTSLYPSDARPVEGVFAQRRWLALQARGHVVRVVHPRPFALSWIGPAAWRAIAAAPRHENRLGLEVLRPRYWHWPARAATNAKAFAAVGVKALQSLGTVDVVFADYAWPAAQAARAVRAWGRPMVIHGRGSDILQVAGEPKLRPALVDALATAGNWCAVSADLVAHMDELGGAPGRGVLIPNGVDSQLFAPGDRLAARSELGLDPHGTVILVVGHLIERKDPLLALASARAWHAQHAQRKQAHEHAIVFVGAGVLEPALRAQAALCKTGPKERGLCVRLEGELAAPALASWYRAADVLLLTSTREGRPNVVLEALASGLPVLATEAGGTGELLEGLPMCLAATRDPDQLAKALAALLKRPPAAADLRERALRLSWQASTDRLETYLQAVRAAQNN